MLRPSLISLGHLEQEEKDRRVERQWSKKSGDGRGKGTRWGHAGTGYNKADRVSRSLAFNEEEGHVGGNEDSCRETH